MKEKSALSQQLSVLASDQKSGFNNPFSDEAVSPKISLKDLNENLKANEKKSKVKGFEKIEARISKLADGSIIDDEQIEKFDDYVTRCFQDDEDEDFRNNLVGLGRKYARDTGVNGETSEITRAFSGTEKQLTELLTQVKADSAALGKDINAMRMSHHSNNHFLSELASAHLQSYNTSLSIIKELNAMKKTQFELKMKIDKGNADTSDASATASKAIQGIFGMGRSNLISTVGGYEGSSGATQEGIPNAPESSEYSDEAIQARYFNNDSGESDGDKFLKYENVRPHYVLLVNETTGSKDIIVEDEDGNMIPDYPIPKDRTDNSFDINTASMSATDSYMMEYEVRYV